MFWEGNYGMKIHALGLLLIISMLVTYSLWGLIIILLSILNCYITLKIIIDILQQNTIFVPQNTQQRTTENYRHIQCQITSKNVYL